MNGPVHGQQAMGEVLFYSGVVTGASTRDINPEKKEIPLYEENKF
ncbi:hypothetical protein QTG56_01900 [Rossellomorea sp. AcN35-11]|nr:hypothetical protein QTG56_01900 [Rossellomorea sp. AcN35-11]